MTRSPRSLVMFVLCAFSLLWLLAGMAQAQSELPPEPVGMAALADFEREVMALLNQERAKVGCPGLIAHPTLRAVAYAHSQDMAARDFFDHINPDGQVLRDRINATSYEWQAIAENIAGGYATPAEVVAGWLSSGGHRANILNCAYLDSGVGYTYDANSTWRHYWTQVFGRQPNATPPPAPSPTPTLTPTPTHTPSPTPTPTPTVTPVPTLDPNQQPEAYIPLLPAAQAAAK